MEKPLPIKILFVPLGDRIFPGAGRGNYRTHDENSAYHHGASEFRTGAVQLFDTAVQALVALGMPVSEMEIIELAHSLGNAEWRSSARGRIVICRCDEDYLLEHLREHLRKQRIGPDEVSLHRFGRFDGTPSLITLDHQFSKLEEADIIENPLEG